MTLGNGISQHLQRTPSQRESLPDTEPHGTLKQLTLRQAGRPSRCVMRGFGALSAATTSHTSSTSAAPGWAEPAKNTSNTSCARQKTEAAMGARRRRSQQLEQRVQASQSQGNRRRNAGRFLERAMLQRKKHAGQ